MRGANSSDEWQCALVCPPAGLHRRRVLAEEAAHGPGPPGAVLVLLAISPSNRLSVELLRSHNSSHRCVNCGGSKPHARAGRLSAQSGGPRVE